jgi:hypothetical protein
VTPIEAEPAPAGADVEHSLAGFHCELCGDMALLGHLRLFQRHIRALEIGAGILHVGVEEELVEFARQIVVALDVAPGARGRVDLLEPAESMAQAFDGLGPRRFDAARSHILVEDAQEAEHVALDDFQLAFHEGFAQRQHGIEGDGAFGVVCLDHDMDGIAAAVAEGDACSVRAGHGEISRSNQPFDNALQQFVHRKIPIIAKRNQAHAVPIDSR